MSLSNRPIRKLLCKEKAIKKYRFVQPYKHKLKLIKQINQQKKALFTRHLIPVPCRIQEIELRSYCQSGCTNDSCSSNSKAWWQGHGFDSQGIHEQNVYLGRFGPFDWLLGYFCCTDLTTLAFENNDTFFAMWCMSCVTHSAQSMMLDNTVLQLFWLLSSWIAFLKINVNLYILQITFLQIATTFKRGGM